MSNDLVESVLPSPKLEIDLSTDLRRYPDKNYLELKKSASAYFSVSLSRIAVGSGVDELIVFSILTLGKKTILCCPTFPIYENCLKTFGKDYIKIDFGPSYNVKADQVLESTSNKTSLIVLSSPNNPTGNIVRRKELTALLDSVSCYVIIDEVYAELAGVSNLDLIKKYKNLIIFRSLSKAFSLAGIRIGFAIGNEKTISKIETVRKKVLPYSISVLSEQVAVAAFKQKDFPEKNRFETSKRRQWLQNRLRDIGNLKIYPSTTNFILVEALSSEMKNKLKSRCVSDCSIYGLPSNFFRIGLADKTELEKLLDVIK